MQLPIFLSRALAALQLGFARLRHTLKRLGWVKVALGIAAIIIFILIVKHVISGAKIQEPLGERIPSVMVASVRSLSANLSPLSLAGVVNSLFEASVRAESSGEITTVNYALGDYVSAGSIIAQLENRSQRASVLQAQGMLDAASVSVNVSQTTLDVAQDSAVTAALSAYNTIDNAIRRDADPMFSNPDGSRPILNVQSSDTQAKIDAENKRVAIGTVLNRERASAGIISSSSDNLVAELLKTESELAQARDFFDTLVRELNAGIATIGFTDAQLTTYKATATAARGSVITALSSLLSARQGLENAQKNGAQGSGTSASAALIKQAQGALAGAEASLEKTIIRAPISGTINALPLKRGDFISASSLAVTIANNGALEVLTFVTENDAREIRVGSRAMLQGTTGGIVTRVAPAIDPTTKKIEVRIGLVGKSTFINGQSVTIELSRVSGESNGPLTRLTIPLAALKIGSSNMSVFTVATSSTLEAHPVTIGELLGDRVVITAGVTPDMMIVTDARGLRAGETVTIR